MKKYSNCLLLCILPVILCFGQTKDETKLFAMIYSPGNEWNHNITFDQQSFFMEHSKHIQNLRKEGKVVVGGRYSDKGFMILRAKDSINAVAIVQQDPSVTNSVFEVEPFEFRPFYSGCVENK
ncbi:MAG: YciI family protein [Bacteroidota bacterium]